MFLDDSDSKFAWQVFAGVRQAISDNIDVSLRYRYFNTGNADVVTFGASPDDARAKFRSHSLLAGLTFNFGAPPPN